MTAVEKTPNVTSQKVTRWQALAEIFGWLIWGGACAVGYLTWFIRSTGFQEVSGIMMALAGVSELVIIACCVLAAIGGVLLIYGVAPPADASQLVVIRVRAFRVMIVSLIGALGVIAIGVNIGSFTSNMVDLASTDENSDGRTVRVMSHNLLYRNPEPDYSAAQILAQDADVLVLTEYTAVHRRALQAAGIARQYPHGWEEVAGGGDGIAIWSKFPMNVHAVHRLTRKTPQVTIDVNGVALELIGVHLAAPTHRASLPYWESDVDNLNRVIGQSDVPVIVAGDFNSTVGHHRFRSMMGNHDLHSAHDVAGGGLGGTWPTNFLVAPVMRIDHILITAEHQLIEYERLGSWGSDHRAIAATLWLAPPNLGS